MASLISDWNLKKKYKSYGKAHLRGKNIRSDIIPFIIIAKGNRFEGITAET